MSLSKLQVVIQMSAFHTDTLSHNVATGQYRCQ